MHLPPTPLISEPRGRFDNLIAREVGAARLEQSNFLFNRVEAVVKNLLAAHPFPSFPRANADSSRQYLNCSDFDPANPLKASVTVGQKFAVKTLLGIDSREAQEAKRDSFHWIRGQFDKLLDEPEQSYEQCFEEIWRFFRRLYLCGKGKVIAHFYNDVPLRRWADEEQEKLRVFVKETVETDLLAAKPEALELMAFAANFFSAPSMRDDLSTNLRVLQQGTPVYGEELSYQLISRLASLGVPLAEDLLVARMQAYAAREGDWDRFNAVCQKLAELGNRSAQKYFGEMLEQKLNLDFLSLEELSKLRQNVKWFFEKCPVTSCDFLAKVLELGEIGALTIDLGVEERLDRLKRRFSAGDESAGNALSRIYMANQMGVLPLSLSPMERVEALTKLAESSKPCLVHRDLTNIYNTNRIGESILSFSLEERYKRIEALAQQGSRKASHIMLFAYLKNQLSLPEEAFFLESPSVIGTEEKPETLPLNLTYEERLEKLCAIGKLHYMLIIDGIFIYLDRHKKEFDFRVWRPLLFELLMRRPGAITARQLLGLSQNQVRIIDLLSSFHVALGR